MKSLILILLSINLFAIDFCGENLNIGDKINENNWRIESKKSYFKFNGNNSCYVTLDKNKFIIKKEFHSYEDIDTNYLKNNFKLGEMQYVKNNRYEYKISSSYKTFNEYKMSRKIIFLEEQYIYNNININYQKICNSNKCLNKYIEKK